MSAPWWFDFGEEIAGHRAMPLKGREQLIVLNEVRSTFRRIKSRRDTVLWVGGAALGLIAVWTLVFTWASVRAPNPWAPLLCALVMLGMGALTALQVWRLVVAVTKEEDDAKAARKRNILIGSILLLGFLLLPSLSLVIILVAGYACASHHHDLQFKIEVEGKSLRPEEVVADSRYQAAAGAISILEQCSRLRDQFERRSSREHFQAEYPRELDTAERYEDEAWGMLEVLADSFAEHPFGQSEGVVSVHWKLLAIKCIPMLTELSRLRGRR